jgi:hypothetical protein
VVVRAAARGQQSGPLGTVARSRAPAKYFDAKMDIHFSFTLFVDITIYITQLSNCQYELKPDLALTGDGALPTFRLDAERDLYRAQAVTQNAFELRGSVL